ncbi:hypothetical protein KKH59_01830 [Patescibacteria group bacterium]|nr:hypothetical protein [Patescibacteria group bacterium]
MNRKELTAACLVLFILVAFYCFAEKKTEISWQKSEGITVQLGVRDKNGELKKYRALFIVRDKNGKEYKLEKDVRGDVWGFVYFPEDFKVYGEPGDYTWKCIVKGKVAASGQFRLTTVKTDCDQATVMRE